MYFRRGFTLIDPGSLSRRSELRSSMREKPRAGTNVERSARKSGFTLIELLVVIAIVAVLAVVVVLVLNPAQLLMQARDSNRLSDLATINAAMGYLKTDQTSATLGSVSTSYISVPDPSATSTSGDQCQGLGMLSLTSSTWQCAASSTSRRADGTGWIPAALSSVSYGTPLAQLPADPANVTSTGLFYSYATNGSQYEIAATLESSKYKTQFATNPQIPGYPEVVALGSSLSLSPLWNPSGLVGYWPMDEGTGSSTVDASGNGNGGAWNGSSTNGTYYSVGKVGPYAGNFNGSNNYVLLTNADALNPYPPFTVSAWLNAATFPSTASVFGKGNGGGGYDFRYDNGTIFDLVKYGIIDQTASVSLSTGAWTLFTAVQNTSSVSFYKNGLFVATYANTSTYVTTTATAYIGASRGPTASTNGQIDDVRMYNRALSAAEVQALYNAEK